MKQQEERTLMGERLFKVLIIKIKLLRVLKVIIFTKAKRLQGQQETTTVITLLQVIIL
jgi:hypothetical protein